MHWAITPWLLAQMFVGIVVTGWGEGCQPVEAANPVFRAGAAASNITPALGEPIVGGWSPTPARHIHDELFARCLVLDDGKVKLGLVLCDNVGIPEEVFDLAKEQVHQATGIAKSHLLMAATHTHSATTARGASKILQTSNYTDYQRFLARRICDGVQRAVNQLEPARIGWGAVDEPSEVFNRRWFVTDASLLANPFGGLDRVRMNPPRGHRALDRQAGPTDPEISFLSVKSLDGAPIALLANYSLHYVGGVPTGDVSADYFGYFARFIEEKLGATDRTPPFVGILSNGTSGDVNNIDFTQESPNKHAPYDKMQKVARKVATRVHEAHQHIEFHDWVPLAASVDSLPLKVRKPTAEMLEHFGNRDRDEHAAPRHRREQIYADRIQQLVDAPEVIRVPLQVMQIGDLGIAALPFETFAETGLELKQRSPFGSTFTIELANGSYGYLPTPAQHRLGGYETWLGTNYVEKEASTKIVASILKLFGDLQDASEASVSHNLRIVSYNIKHGRGNDGKVNLARTAQALRSLNPDVVGLQEVDNCADRSGGIDQANALGRELKMHAAFGSFMPFQGGQYGMAILSRYPIRHSREIELPEGHEPRIALAAEVHLPTGERFMVINVHFDWVRDDAFRFAQASKLAEYLDGLTIPYILLGDFNDTPGSRTLKLFQDLASEAKKPRNDRFTFSSSKPAREIDFIFAAPRSIWNFESTNVHTDPVTSDHRPVVTNVQYGRDATVQPSASSDAQSDEPR